jgi:hypothetical protein
MHSSSVYCRSSLRDPLAKEEAKGLLLVITTPLARDRKEQRRGDTKEIDRSGNRKRSETNRILETNGEVARVSKVSWMKCLLGWRSKICSVRLRVGCMTQSGSSKG